MSNELRDIVTGAGVLDQLKVMANIYGFHADYIQDLKNHIRKLYSSGKLGDEEYKSVMDAIGDAQHHLYEAAVALDYVTDK